MKIYYWFISLILLISCSKELPKYEILEINQDHPSIAVLVTESRDTNLLKVLGRHLSDSLKNELLKQPNYNKNNYLIGYYSNKQDFIDKRNDKIFCSYWVNYSLNKETIIINN